VTPFALEGSVPVRAGGGQEGLIPMATAGSGVCTAEGASADASAGRYDA
jgi:hypothetical protein